MLPVTCRAVPQVDSPVNWSVDQVQQLQYAHLVHKVTEQQREWTGLYDKLVAEGLVNKAAPPPSKQVGGGTAAQQQKGARSGAEQ